jgi:glutathione peroxidase
MHNKFYNLQAISSTGKSIDFKQFENKVVLIVNTATQCGLTPQFEGLEKLHNHFKEQGLVVLGFPCNQFGKQEPLSNNEMEEQCLINHGVTFTLTQKIDVNGRNTHLVFAHLKSKRLLFNNIKWNFTKFLIDKQGNLVKRYWPITKPQAIEQDIIALLK